MLMDNSTYIENNYTKSGLKHTIECLKKEEPTSRMASIIVNIAQSLHDYIGSDKQKMYKQVSVKLSQPQVNWLLLLLEGIAHVAKYGRR